MKILVVEDNQQIMETICDFLELKGHQVDCAYHGEAALTILQQQHFNIIIMDIMMPKLDGVQTVTKLRRDYHVNTPILFLTARDHLDDKLAAFEAGGDDYLIKPFAMEELLVRLEALSKRGLRQDVQLLQVGELSFDLATQHASRAGQTAETEQNSKRNFKVTDEPASRHGKPRSAVRYRLAMRSPRQRRAAQPHLRAT